MSVKSTQGFNDFPMPIGSVIAYSGSIDAVRMPMNYLVCDGTSYFEVDYPELFSVIGTTFGSFGVGKFNVPDLVGFVPKFDNVVGQSQPTPTSSGVVFANISLTEQELPSITGMAIGADINGSFQTGSSTTSKAKIDGDAIGNNKVMTTWNSTSTVDMTSNSAPQYIYSNGTGVVAPVDFSLVDVNTFVIKSVEMVFIIKTKNHFFPN